METGLLLQYILAAVIVMAACYSIFRMVMKAFSPKKFSSKRKNCERDCGCS